jgi:hypothetical protein
VTRGQFPNAQVPRLTIASRMPETSALQRKAS